MPRRHMGGQLAARVYIKDISKGAVTISGASVRITHDMTNLWRETKLAATQSSN